MFYVSLSLSFIAMLVTLNLTPGLIKEIEFLNYTLIPFQVDRVSLLVGIIFALIGFLSILYACNRASKKFLLLTNFYAASALLVVFAGDLFSFYFFWELMTISSFFLIINKDYPLTSQSSYYYFVMHLAGGISLLWAIMLHFNATGSLVLTQLSRGVPFMLLAVGIKSAVIGLHTWLPMNYIRVPFHITVVLAAFTTKVGVYGLYRLAGPGNLIAYAGAFSALLGVILALKERKVRLIFCYSVISQLGYIIAAFGVGTITASSGGLLHLFNHILYKGSLFMIIGVIIYTTGSEDLAKLGGLARKLPYTTFSAVIASLAIIGLPLTNGYISKLIIKEGLNMPLLSPVLYITAIGTTLVYLKFIYFAFFRKKEIKLKRKPGLAMLIPIKIISLLIIISGIRPDLLSSIRDIQLEINYFSLYNIQYALQPFLWGLVLFIAGHRFFSKYYESFSAFDPYLFVGQKFSQLSSILSATHNGNLSRYLVWALSMLSFLWIYLLIR